MPKDAQISHISLAEQARDALRDQIISGKLKPSERIDLNELAQKWSVSPTPLRDAVNSLEAAGLVDIHPRRGVFVAVLDREGLRETYQLRAAFEGMAARLVATTAPLVELRMVLERMLSADTLRGRDRRKRLIELDDLIHDFIFDHCPNRKLKRMMASVRDVLRWSQRTIIHAQMEGYEASLPEHIAICRALIDRNPDAAEATMRRHLNNTLTRLEGYLDMAA